jgi:hypothetical protein
MRYAHLAPDAGADAVALLDDLPQDLLGHSQGIHG